MLAMTPPATRQSSSRGWCDCRQYAGYRRGDAKSLDQLQQQLQHQVHHQLQHQLQHHSDQLYSPSPARKGISSSLTGQKGSDTSGEFTQFTPLGAGTGQGWQQCYQSTDTERAVLPLR